MTKVIQGDELEGLPNAGRDIGGFTGNVAPGFGALMITKSAAEGTGKSFYAVSDRISDEARGKKRRHKKYKLKGK